MEDLDTATSDLLVRVDGHVCVLSLNRPDRRNALSAAIFEGFTKVLPSIGARNDIRVLMLSGEGGAFSSGGDVKGFSESHAQGSSVPVDEAIASIQRLQAGLSLALRRLPQPVVASLPGAAAGAGLSIALAADLRIAAESAIIVTAFANIGTSGDFGTSWFLPRLVGEAKAKELMFLSPRLSAHEAADLGIVNAVLADADYDNASLAWCHALAARSPVALRLMKQNVNRSFNTTLDEALDAEAVAMVHSMGTADHREAVAAFVEKRSASFKGE